MAFERSFDPFEELLFDEIACLRIEFTVFGADFAGEMIGEEFPASSEEDGVLHHMPKFAGVTAPATTVEGGAGFAAER